MNVYEAGPKVLPDGHNAKSTLNYRARSDFNDQARLPSGANLVPSVRHRPKITLQTQVHPQG